MRDETKALRLDIRITKTLKEKLKSLAKRKGVSASMFICDILEALPDPNAPITPRTTPSTGIAFFSRKVAESPTKYEV